MPEGRFSEAETRAQLRRIELAYAARRADFNRDEARLQMALNLIKRNITEAHTEQNQDLHNAVQLVVEFARKHDHLTR